MKAAAAMQIERALADALATRLLGATSFAAAEADLEMVRSLHARTPHGALAKALAHLLTLLASDHPQRQGLLEEAEQARASAKLPGTSDGGNAAARPVAVAPSGHESVPPRANALSLDPQVAWHLPPAFVGEWTDVTDTTAEALVDRVRAAYPRPWDVGVAEGVRAVRRMVLSCYPAFDAVEVLFQFDNRPLASQLVLLGPEIALWVTGISSGLHDLNARRDQSGTPLLDISTEAKASEYLRLFCGAVHGEDGPFLILRDAAELARHMVPDAPYDLPEDAFVTTPMLRLDDEGSEAAWQMQATVLYSNALYRSTFQIERSGNVNMIEDSPVIQDLPVLRQGMVRGLRQIRGKD